LLEFHAFTQFRPQNTRTGEIAFARKNQVIAHRFNFNAVGDAVHVAHNFLEIGAGQIDNGGIFHFGNDELLIVGLNQPQFLATALANIAVLVLQTEMRDNAVVVIVFFNVDGQCVQIGDGRYDLE